jgi:hypothetical protein
MTTNNIYQILSEVFPEEMERTVTKSGTTLKYIPVSEVINRLNKALGVDKWSLHIVKCERDAIDPDYVVAHVRIDWYTDNDAFSVISRDGFGGQKIKRNKQGVILDLGDEFKGAISDALKKAAQTFGVGLYLARSEDAMEIEQVIESEAEVKAMQASVSPEISAKWDSFASIAKSLSQENKDKLNEYWATYSNNKPKPKRETVSEVDIDKLIVEATRLALGGEYVVLDEK